MSGEGVFIDTHYHARKQNSMCSPFGECKTCIATRYEMTVGGYRKEVARWSISQQLRKKKLDYAA